MYIFIYEMLCKWFSKRLSEEKVNMKISFDEIIEKVLKHEGGYVNDP